MKTVKMNVPVMREEEIPLCPYCGGIPVVEVDIQKTHTESDRIASTDLCCPYCGLLAPKEVWYTIAGTIEKNLA